MPQQQWQRAFLMGAHSETPLKTINSTGQRIITDELPKQDQDCDHNPEDNFFLLLYYHGKNMLYYHGKNINLFYKRSTLHYYSDCFGDTESRIPQLGFKKGATPSSYRCSLCISAPLYCKPFFAFSDLKWPSSLERLPLSDCDLNF